MDQATFMSECARRAWHHHGISWTKLSFDRRYEIVQETEAEHPSPKSAPVLTVPTRRADGSSEGLSGGVGKPFDGLASKTPGAGAHAVELLRQAHRELEGEYIDRRGWFDNRIR
jgi:hypothetical protein